MAKFVGHEIPVSFCPDCGKRFDRAALLNDKEDRPVPGDITLCIGCAAVLHFDNEMAIRKLPTLDLLSDEKRADVEKVVRMIKQMRPRN